MRGASGSAAALSALVLVLAIVLEYVVNVEVGVLDM